MLVLALDTSTLSSSVGWATFDEGPRAEATGQATFLAPAKPGHAETILERIDQLLTTGGWSTSDIDLVVCTRGPGTFTGLRIGLSTVKGLALDGELPVVTFSSLEALALTSDREGLVATCIDARRQELFGGLYRVERDASGWPQVTCQVPDAVAPAEDLAQRLATAAAGEPVYLVGNGVSMYAAAFEQAFADRGVQLPAPRNLPDPYWMARLGLEKYRHSGGEDISSLEPVYIREPDARLPS